jgi:hypothetical protein
MAHNKDWREWLESLNASGVEYVVVGGIALAFHGIVRYTGDLDVLVHASASNSERLVHALRRFGFGSLQLAAADFTAPDRVVQLGYPPGRIDILTSIDGVSWEQVHAGAVAGDYAGVPVRYISRHDLVRNKRATGRAQDVVDAERLERGR